MRFDERVSAHTGPEFRLTAATLFEGSYVLVAAHHGFADSPVAKFLHPVPGFDDATHILLRTKELAIEAKDLIGILFVLFLLLRHCIESLFSK